MRLINRLSAPVSALTSGITRRVLAWFSRFACISVTVLCCAADVFGQTPPDRTVIHRNVLWTTANTVLQANKHWGVFADLSHRRSDFAKDHDLTLLRFAPAFWITPDLSVAAGYAHLWSTVSGTAGEITLDENRLHQQLIYVLRSGRGSFSNRLRIEERWREATVNGKPSNTFYTTRYRYLLGYRHPLSRTPRAPQLVLAEEIMLHTGKTVRHGIFEQNRLFGGVQWKFSKRLSLETGYMYTWQKLLPENSYQSIHTIRLTLSYERMAGSEKHIGPAAPGTHH